MVVAFLLEFAVARSAAAQGYRLMRQGQSRERSALMGQGCRASLGAATSRANAELDRGAGCGRRLAPPCRILACFI
jgi:hypothetical protein